MLRLMVRLVLAAIAIMAVALGGCTGGTKDTVLAPEVLEGQPAREEASHNRVLWGIWDIQVDIREMKATAVPVRDLEVHFNVTGMLEPPACDDCISITINSFNPVTRIVDADVNLKNPSQLNGYDVRGILFATDYGHELVNADDWTGLWDVLGGMLVNPFKAYAKGFQDRMFAAMSQHTEKYFIRVPEPPHWNKIVYAVDASWPENCREPYEITNFWQDEIYDSVGSSGNISVKVRDWQNNVDSVVVYASLITGETYTHLTSIGDDTWGLLLTNNMGAPAGTYEAQIKATSSDSGNLALYDFVDIKIDTTPGVPDNPVDVTPPWLNVCMNGISKWGDYVYIPSGPTGLHIFDVSDPTDPQWVKNIDIPQDASCVTTANGYAFVCDNGTGWPEQSGLDIINIQQPESAYIEKVIELDLGSGQPYIALYSGYTYICEGYNINIIDTDPVETAFVVTTVQTDVYLSDIVIDEGYAYVVGSWGDMHIFDIDPPEETAIIKTLETPCEYLIAIDADNGYAYVASDKDGLQIIDVSPPHLAHVVNTVDTPKHAVDVVIQDSYAYVADVKGGIQVVDISTPESAYIVNAIETTWPVDNLDVNGGYAYTGSVGFGLQIVDIDQLGGANTVGTRRAVGVVFDVAVNDGLIYLAKYSDTGMSIVDINTPESPEIINSIETRGESMAIALNGEYAYLTSIYNVPYGKNTALQVFYVESPDSVFLLNSVAWQGGSPADVAVSAGYAYVTDGDFEIIDIDPPESATIVNSLGFPGFGQSLAYAVDICGTYAYVAFDPYFGDKARFWIVDISDPVSAYKVKSMIIADAQLFRWGGIDVVNGYAYTTLQPNFCIIDVDPPESLSITKEIELWNGEDTVVSGDYAYVLDYVYGLKIIDINPHDTAHEIYNIDVPGGAVSLVVNDGYAYVGAFDAGLRIIKLW